MKSHAIATNVPSKELTPKLLLQMERLWTLIWNDGTQELPTEKDTEELWNRWFETPRPNSEIYHCIHSGEQLAALCRTFLRKITFPNKQQVTVLALAGVCSHPDLRGRGLGRLVVEQAFRRTENPNIHACLFQTGIPSFYQQWGASEVHCDFRNSLNKNDSEENPWWEDHVMVYPGSCQWPQKGAVDLIGSAY